MSHEVRYLTRADVEALGITMDEVIQRTELAFSEKGRGLALMPPKHWIAPDKHRFFSAMSSALPGIGAVACKWQSGSDRNAEQGLPYITGLLILNRLEDGLPVSIMDSTWITEKRTAAATAVTARYLSTPDPSVAAIIGCGVQGRSNVEALTCIHRGIEQVRGFDINPDALERFGTEIKNKHGVPVMACGTVQEALSGADIVVTCGPIVPDGDRTIRHEWLDPGALLVTLDYDCYIAPGTLASVDAVFTDDQGQIDHLQDYGFFLEAPDNIIEIGAVVAGTHRGRNDQRQRIVALNMGIALEDVSLASLINDRAGADRKGTMLGL